MQSRAKQDSRKKDFKKGITADDSRRKREETSNEIRKSKREESLQKRRNIAPSGQIEITQQSIHTEWTGNLSEIPQYIEAINSADPVAQLEATTQIRKLLSIEKNPPISAVVQSGALPRLITFLGNSANTKLQFEAAWAITNIASGSSEHTLMVVNCGAVPIFIGLLSAVDEELREQSVWALGNIAGDSSKCRDYCLHAGMLVPLLKILSSGTSRLSMMRNATWALSNLCRGKPAPKFNHVAPALSVLAKLIHSSDQEVVVDALWALSYLSDGPDEQIQAVIDAGVAQRIVELLSSNAVSVQTPALRTVGNFVTGNDNQTQAIINLRAIPMLYQLLQNPRKSLRKEAAWAISNITAGNKNQTQHVINEGVIPLLVGHLNHGDFDIKKEACWAISNALSWRDQQQVNYLVQCNCVKPLCDMLNQKDAKIVGVALDAIEHILYVGDKFAKTPNSNLYSSVVEEVEGIDKIEALQNHENESIYKKAVSILEQYFGAEEESENAVPNVQPMQTHAFTFGAPISAPTGGFAF